MSDGSAACTSSLAATTASLPSLSSYRVQLIASVVSLAVSSPSSQSLIDMIISSTCDIPTSIVIMIIEYQLSYQSMALTIEHHLRYRYPPFCSFSSTPIIKSPATTTTETSTVGIVTKIPALGTAISPYSYANCDLIDSIYHKDHYNDNGDNNGEAITAVSVMKNVSVSTLSRLAFDCWLLAHEYEYDHLSHVASHSNGMIDYKLCLYYGIGCNAISVRCLSDASSAQLHCTMSNEFDDVFEQVDKKQAKYHGVRACESGYHRAAIVMRCYDADGIHRKIDVDGCGNSINIMCKAADGVAEAWYSHNPHSHNDSLPSLHQNVNRLIDELNIRWFPSSSLSISTPPYTITSHTRVSAYDDVNKEIERYGETYDEILLFDALAHMYTHATMVLNYDQRIAWDGDEAHPHNLSWRAMSALRGNPWAQNILAGEARYRNQTPYLLPPYGLHVSMIPLPHMFNDAYVRWVIIQANFTRNATLQSLVDSHLLYDDDHHINNDNGDGKKDAIALSSLPLYYQQVTKHVKSSS
jgi:hypothetical protein